MSGHGEASRGRLPEKFIEGMCCESGCFNGPDTREQPAKAARNRTQLLQKADGRTIVENLENYDRTKFSGYR